MGGTSGLRGPTCRWTHIRQSLLAEMKPGDSGLVFLMERKTRASSSPPQSQERTETSRQAGLLPAHPQVGFQVHPGKANTSRVFLWVSSLFFESDELSGGLWIPPPRCPQPQHRGAPGRDGPAGCRGPAQFYTCQGLAEQPLEEKP